MFANIKHIDDVLPHIEGRKDFLIADKGDYTVIDYLYSGPDTFDHSVRLECRGITFNKDGYIIRRPLHKFFNVGEKLQAHEIDWSQNHIVMDKRDGSMIAPAIVNGEVRFMTRLGITEHAERAERHLTDKLRQYCHALMVMGCTPIFEWTSPENRIVLDYERDELTLLAIRQMVSGAYVPVDECRDWAYRMGVEFVEQMPMRFDAKEMINVSKAITGIEGFVIHFPETGHHVKIKTDEYVQMHRAVSFFEREDKILPVVLEGKCDDLYPALSEKDTKRLRDYETAIQGELTDFYTQISDIVAGVRGLERKQIALEVVPQYPKPLHGVIFGALDGKDTLKQAILRNPELLKARW